MNFSKLEKTSILVVGDVMLDEYVYGDVRRISAEAPVPVVTVGTKMSGLGGAGNVAANIASLGASGVSLVCSLGMDVPGETVRKLARTRNITLRVAKDSDNTTVKTRIVGPQNQQMIRLDCDTYCPASREIGSAVKAFITNGDYRAVVIADYAKGAVTPQLVAKICALAVARDIPVVLDPKPSTPYRPCMGLTVIKPNRSELASMTGCAVATDSEVLTAAKKLGKRLRTCVAVSCGLRGVCLVMGEDHFWFPGVMLPLMDVSGAGDTLSAAMGLALGTGSSLPEAVRIGNMAAGIAVGKTGTAQVSLAELQLVHRQLKGGQGS